MMGVTASTHGRQIGAAPVIFGGDAVYCHTLFDFASAQGAVSITGLYAETIKSIGYFGKAAKDLSSAECATLAGLLKRPQALSPWNNKEGSTVSRNLAGCAVATSTHSCAARSAASMRAQVSAAVAVCGHQDLKSTRCPGRFLEPWVKTYAR